MGKGYKFDYIANGCVYFCDPSEHLKLNKDKNGCECEKGYKMEKDTCVEDGAFSTVILSIFLILFFFF